MKKDQTDDHLQEPRNVQQTIAVLPWMRNPLNVESYDPVPLQKVVGLHPRLYDALHEMGISNLFPVQVAVWHEAVGLGGGEQDICVCSPTGSGKTLAYALPIVQMLSTRVIRRLRALVVLPTRDLALQVKSVFDCIAPAVGLSVGLAVGQTRVSAEAAKLVLVPKPAPFFAHVVQPEDRVAESGVDILVATPGRLMDHLSSTAGFTLEHLSYLVVDETDRLLRQSYQNWLPAVLEAVDARSSTSKDSRLPGLRCERVHTIRQEALERGLKGITLPRVVKMVLSATFTKDPAKILQVKLYRPIYIASSLSESRYKIPEELQAYYLVCKAGEKPLYLATLLQRFRGQKTIVFTASVEETHRLYLLLTTFEDLLFEVVEYSSWQHQLARSKALAAFRNGDAQVLVASDAMTRGMDVEGVLNVVNYDVPVYAKTYVHRVGRTARAGRPGCAYTLMRKEEVRHFKAMLRKAENSSCKEFKLTMSATKALQPQYVQALERLKEIVASEAAVKVSRPTKAQSSVRHNEESGDMEVDDEGDGIR